MPNISIIILTFNSGQYIKSCLSSVFNQSDQDFEISVVDNGSVDNTLLLIKQYFPSVAVIKNTENLGACKARNQGIEVSNGKWVLTLDCDVVLKDDFLSNIIKAAGKADKSIGMLQPKILHSDKKTIYSCGAYLSKFFRRFYDMDRDKTDGDELNSKRQALGACSAAALYRRSMLEDIKDNTGYFDERFFFLVEDVDLAWRSQRKGYKALDVPDAICYHKGNSSSTNAKLRQYLCLRNRFLMIRKNEGLAAYALRILPLLFYDLPRLLFMAFSNPYIFKGVGKLCSR